jgi:hypothetical protein
VLGLRSELDAKQAVLNELQNTLKAQEAAYEAQLAALHAELQDNQTPHLETEEVRRLRSVYMVAALIYSKTACPVVSRKPTHQRAQSRMHMHHNTTHAATTHGIECCPIILCLLSAMGRCICCGCR